MAESQACDVLIVGGGMVGASLALALRNQGMRIVIIEAHPFGSDSQPSYDDRSIALSYGSMRILEGIGLLEKLKQLALTPIQHIHISDQKHIGKTRLHAEEEGVEALGAVVENRVMGQALAELLNKCDDIEVITPAQVSSIEQQTEFSQVTVEVEGEPRSINSRLLVAADGAQSSIRESEGIATIKRDYGQTAIIANVSSEKHHHHVAYERFTNTGPLALLPMSNDAEGRGRCSLVWSARNSEVEELMGLSDEAFLERLQQRFGERLGAFIKTGQRFAFPLSLLQIRERVRERLVIIGNAAHILHPVAGQGFNLGLRDVATLAQILVDGWRRGEDIGRLALLKSYSRWRDRDTLTTALFTDGLVRIFSNDFLPLAAVRNIGLEIMDVIPLFKRTLSRQAMGLSGKQPRLMRGLPL
jgi:2-octaprenyl-6-methoxyphenol hydroxylase